MVWIKKETVEKTVDEVEEEMTANDDAISRSSSFHVYSSTKTKEAEAEKEGSDGDVTILSVQYSKHSQEDDSRRTYRSSHSEVSSRETSPVFFHKITEQERIKDKVLESVVGRKIHDAIQDLSLIHI